jgi:23S rRNA (cytosine1962-C5)-methyltransferase
MILSADYELLDFGGGRKLERFGAVMLDRPAPATSDVRRFRPELWSQATARFDVMGDQRHGERGKWIPADALPAQWTVAFGALRFELKPNDFGHVGVFPEQTANWKWLARRIRAAATEIPRLKVLNLFAHTGGSTLAAAMAGAEVVHVDSARNVVAWARRNAELSSLAAAPIRWIVEDAPQFVRRELKRGNHYDAVILDPPSFGHGPAGETWKLEDDLAALLSDCAEVTAGRRQFILLTCHTPSVTPAIAGETLASALGVVSDLSVNRGDIAAETLDLRPRHGRSLSCGIVARFCKA